MNCLIDGHVPMPLECHQVIFDYYFLEHYDILVEFTRLMMHVSLLAFLVMFIEYFLMRFLNVEAQCHMKNAFCLHW